MVPLLTNAPIAEQDTFQTEMAYVLLIVLKEHTQILCQRHALLALLAAAHVLVLLHA